MLRGYIFGCFVGRSERYRQIWRAGKVSGSCSEGQWYDHRSEHFHREDRAEKRKAHGESARRFFKDGPQVDIPPELTVPPNNLARENPSPS